MVKTMPAIFSVAVFAHNEERHLAATINSILAAGEGTNLTIAILANGCSDHTVTIARAHAGRHPNIHVVEIDLADKSNAWNHYVHDVSARPPFCDAEFHVFVDGDVQVEATSFTAFSSTLLLHPLANAVGALPTSGRDQVPWRRRMLANGTLAGGLYALSRDFVQRLRQRQVRLPRGLIGEDWAVSLFALSDLNALSTAPPRASKLVFAMDAGFSFRSLSPWRLRDYRTYLRRLWRYALRGVQYEMLAGLLQHRPPGELPDDVDKIYLYATPPSRLKWVGKTSLLRTIAVQKVRFRRTALAKRST